MTPRVGSVVLVVVTMLSLVRCGRPPLHVTTESQAVVIDMQSLGEYPSEVERLRLSDAATRQVVWEVKGRDESQVGRMRLNVGKNPVTVPDVRHGTYEVVTPATVTSFTLEAGKRYIVEVWGKEGVEQTKREAEFVAPRGS